MSVSPPLSNAANVQVTDGTNAMPTGDALARALFVGVVNSNGPAQDGRNNNNVCEFLSGGGGNLVGVVAPELFNGTTWDRQRANVASTPLPTVTAAKATQQTADQVNYNGKGLLLHVKVANLAGVPTFTPKLQWKDNSGNYNTIWTAAAAISANGDKTYQFYPGAADAGGHTESKQLACPRNFRVQLVYSGNGTTDAADVTIDMEILL